MENTGSELSLAKQESPSWAARRFGWTKIYLAGRFRDQALFKSLRDDLTLCDYKVTSRWIDRSSDRPDDTEWSKEYGPLCAETDFADIHDADVFVLYLKNGVSTRGGMYVELGYALCLDMDIVIIGGRTNVFTYLPCVTTLQGEDELFDWLIKYEASHA